MNSTNSVLLSSGYYMPLVGLGTWQTTDEEEAVKAIEGAIDAGYRHIDTAFVYNNEHFIGKALKSLFESGKIKRDELFITTKLPLNGNGEQYVEYFCRKSLDALQLDYIDLYLIHAPFSSKKNDNDADFMPLVNGVFQPDLTVDILKTWKAMESLVDKGMVRSIGISNFNSEQIQRIYDNSRIKPANLQVECHVYLPQYELHDFCKKKNIYFTAYSPLGSPGRLEFARKRYGDPNMDDKKPNLLQEPKLQAMAEKYNKSPAQVAIHYLIQRGIIVIPKSTNKERIAANLQVLDFQLSEEDMSTLKSMANGCRMFDFLFFPGICEHPEFPFHIPF